MKTNNEVMSAKSKTKPITAYNLYDFSVGIQEAVLEGYRLSTENQHFPVQIGPGLYTAVLVSTSIDDFVEQPMGVVLKDKPKGRTKKVTKE